MLRHLSSFLADASLAFDASGSVDELLQLVAEHALELTGAEQCAVRLTPDATSTIDALASEHQTLRSDPRSASSPRFIGRSNHRAARSV
jgi:hypothetical protein